MKNNQRLAAGAKVDEGPAGPFAHRLPPYLALALGVGCISFTAIFTKWAAVPGPVAATWRMMIATALLALPFGLQRRGQGALPRGAAAFACLAGVWFGINLALLNSALLLTSAATATLLDNTAPIWVGLGALLLLRETLPARYWAGLLLALGGAAVVTGFNPLAIQSLNPGDALALSGAFFYAAYLLTVQRARRQLRTLTSLWLAEASSALALLVVTLLMGLPLLGYGLRAYLPLLGAGIVSQTGGWLLINYALGHVPASRAVVVLLSQPVVTGLLSIPLLGESLTLPQVAGGSLLLAGIYLCLRRDVLPDANKKGLAAVVSLAGPDVEVEPGRGLG